MNHDQFVGQVQHLAQLASRGDAERVIRATLETLGERLMPEAADHLAAQLPPELARNLMDQPFTHLSIEEFRSRVAQREGTNIGEAAFHTRCVMQTIREAVSEGAMRKLSAQLPREFQMLLHAPVVHV